MPDDPMRIAFLLPGNLTIGGVFCIYEHAKRFAAKGHHVCLYFQDDAASLVIDSYDGMEGVSTAHLSDLKSAKKSRQPGVAEPFDFAFATSFSTAYQLHYIPSCFYGYFVQGDEESFPARWRLQDRAFVRLTFREKFDLIIATTPRMAEMVRSRHRKRAHLIPMAIPIERFKSQSPAYPKGDRLRILVEGAANQALKRIPLAFAVIDQIPDVDVFYVTGEGSRRPEWRIDQFFGRVPYRKMPSIYASCDVLLKLSSIESFSMPVLEMFASGGTAVVSAFDGHDQYIRDGHNALVVPVDDLQATVTAIQRLQSDRDLLERLKRGASATAELFCWGRTNDAFESVLAEHRRKARGGRIARQLDVLRRFEWIFLHRGILGTLQRAVGKKMARFLKRAPRSEQPGGDAANS